MGDFERTFGAGADVESIIDYYSWCEAREQEQEEEEILESGRDLPHAQTFYDLTGQIWHPGNDARARLTAPQLSEIDALAQQAADEINKYDEFEWSYVDTAPKLFLEHVRPGLSKIGPSLDAFEAFIGRVVRECSIPIVFARDTSPMAGYVSPSLSTHILAFPDEYYLARLGGLDLDGPFSDFESHGGWCSQTRDSYRAFATEYPGKLVLEISAELRDPDVPIRNVRDWVEAESSNLSEAGAGSDPFRGVALRARATQKRSRTWSDASEDSLRRKVRGILSSLSAMGEAAVFLDPRLTRPVLDHWCYTGGDLYNELVRQVLSGIDVSAFRGLAPSIELHDGKAFSAHERLAGIPVLLETLSARGLDVSAAADALARSDLDQLLQIVSPEAYENARKKKIRVHEEARQIQAEEANRVEAFERHGLKEEDLPF